jgi:hypothetical protein
MRQPLSTQASACPHCGAHDPLNPKFTLGGEWAGARMVGNRPLVHIAWGRDPQTGKLRVANGVIAIGQFAKGDVAIGQLAYGKCFALGQLAASWVAAIGMLAIGLFAIGAFIVALIGLGLKLIGGGIGLDGVHMISGRHH